MTKPLIAITSGEPAGIGPDLCVQLAPHKDARIVVIGDPALLKNRAAELGVEWQADEFNPADTGNNNLTVMPLTMGSACVTGTLNPDNARYVLDTIRTAALGCQSGQFDAMVTAPVHKGVINDAGIAFSGHTEFIAELFDACPLMVLAADKLRVALATTHLPLANVASALNQATIETSLQILHNDLQAKVGIESPRILVCGLNPHAGESGHLGTEEITIIEPAIKAVQQRGIDAVGPLPADTLFTPRHLNNADAVLAMYHDQGLPVLKYAGFGEAVNITFGLPIIRTSVDHGTALDLAGTGKAEGGSLAAAIDTAIHYAGKAS
ncbi:MAG: 4-hydroxythreonine-4-phosphate dehydrogenase PdxA [Pseudomonadota bacterium]